MNRSALTRFLQDGLGTVDLVDELTAASQEVRSCDLQFREFGGHIRFAGPVRTVRCHEDNVLLRETLGSTGNGAILIIDGGGSLHTALAGDLIAGLAVDHGWSGLVINGAVRDSVALARLPLGIKATGTNPRKSGKHGTGSVDVPVGFGGVTFTPEDHVFCDEDGCSPSRSQLRDAVSALTAICAELADPRSTGQRLLELGRAELEQRIDWA